MNSDYPQLDDIVTQIETALKAKGITPEIEQDPLEPHVRTVSTVVDDHLNFGFVAWSESKQRLGYCVYNQEAIRRAELEDIPDLEAKIGWVFDNLKDFLTFMDGTARRVLKEHRRKLFAKEKATQ
jgi:hypothetical protein